MRALSLHHLTVAEVSPAELVRLAAGLGCQHVCLFTQGLGDAFPFRVVRDDEVAELNQLMDELGVSVLGTTTFPVSPTLEVADYALGLERTRRLGSTMANVRFVDHDEARLTDRFGKLAELAAGFGVGLSVEFTAFCPDGALDQALRVIRATGQGSICLDTLHIMRTGTTLEALRGLDPASVGYVQFCDGPLVVAAEDAAREGAFNRLPPGDGEFPLLDLLALMPPDAPICLEVPQDPARLAGVSAAERARRAVEGMRALTARAALEGYATPTPV